LTSQAHGVYPAFPLEGPRGEENNKGDPAMLDKIKKLLKDEEAPTAVEYALMLAAIAGIIIGVVFILGNKVNNTFSRVQSALP
jgi:pilus assembly protein Flp/PilA